MLSKKVYRGNPEGKIADDITKFLEERGWIVYNMHGNMFQKGIPDKLCLHQKYKLRWVEVKNPIRYAFTKAQRFVFPRFEQCGIGIWVMTGATEDEYRKLFKPPNWMEFLHPRDIKWIKTQYDWTKEWFK